MRKKNPFLNSLLAACLIALALDCTCAMASPLASGIKPAASSHAGCHLKDQENPSQQASSDCCGKCGIEKNAVFEKNLAVQKDSSRQYQPARYIVLTAEPDSFALLHAAKFYNSGPDHPAYQNPLYSPSVPRAPPVV